MKPARSCTIDQTRGSDSPCSVVMWVNVAFAPRLGWACADPTGSCVTFGTAAVALVVIARNRQLTIREYTYCDALEYEWALIGANRCPALRAEIQAPIYDPRAQAST